MKIIAITILLMLILSSSAMGMLENHTGNITQALEMGMLGQSSQDLGSYAKIAWSSKVIDYVTYEKWIKFSAAGVDKYNAYILLHWPKANYTSTPALLPTYSL